MLHVEAIPEGVLFTVHTDEFGMEFSLSPGDARSFAEEVMRASWWGARGLHRSCPTGSDEPKPGADRHGASEAPAAGA